MKCESALPAARKLLHVVGRVTDEVFSFLGPATDTLAKLGFEQIVVMIDDPSWRKHLPNLHGSAELILMPSIRNPVMQWHAVLAACRALLKDCAPHAIHLHGIFPCLVGALALRATTTRVPIYYSPHGSRSIGALRPIGALSA